ncbi:6-phosphofructokinase [Acidiluteibacter ferrifornacis]|uniref:ATP-dependent 6-phosphofructokinase n=1 Tax=Acidiluteibacter ferrifornacis TaxID=2692424 RepID=A0A6N9NI64_9FLAO|nr:6-phosphofructokinase [Acidiluteibacter ferrifornacis]NBG66368.1 6-phosphofructokinase [Acidiluteibacter ferrifornacis]
MKKIGVFTSGGDSPGMNAAVRAVVRTGIYNNIEVYGIHRAYDGMIAGDIHRLESKDVSGIIQRGGTIIKSARSAAFRTKEGRKKAYESLKTAGIEGLVAIGGDGTFTGAKIFEAEYGIPSIGVPGTIDNDLFGTDNTIGYDTALNTVVEAVDKIRDTASSHDRLFFVEVMGRDAGFIALRSGIGVGAEAILVPETPTYIDTLIQKIEKGREQHKSSAIIMVAEGDDAGNAAEVARKVKEKFDFYDTKVTVLGHIQRGGSPSAADRVLASRLGVAAVEALLEGKTNQMVGVVNNQIAYTPYEKAIKHHNKLNENLLRLAEILST